MTSEEFISQLHLARNSKTLYCNGTFGWVLNDSMKARCCNLPVSDYRKGKINSADPDTFVFDCCGLIKAIAWGWNQNYGHNYGGANYGSNGVPDVNETGLLNMCSQVTVDFGDVLPGEFLYMPGHCGIYIGNNQAIECTPAFNDGVQITAVPGRGWTHHGKLNFIQY